ncbi:helix-turn-helix domain-containing protein [Paenibacillus sp. GYB003]|uniref:helix-turn-helix domain-containing protein n=1 Tax=Paenibacillus sp. GYB003 TaxID=2994392 RepID=UPI002F9657F0
MYKVLLADDEQLDLDGLRRFTPWEELGMEVAAAVNSGYAALDVMSRETIDVLVTDIRMPNMSGLELARQAAALRPGLKVVFVSGYADFQYAKQAIQMNACSYVLKPVDDEDMAQALRTAAESLDRERFGDNMFYGKGRLIGPGGRDPRVARDVAEPDAVLGDMFAAISRYELVRIDDAIGDLFALASSVGTKHAAYHFVLYAIAKLDDYLREFNESFYKLTGTELQSMELLFRFETAEDVRSWLRRKTFEISEKLHRKRVKKNRRLVEEIKRYVEERLDGSVTVRDAANRFSFAPNYLGHLFKEETGINFSDYVIARRLEKARRLLQDPKLKVYEVAGLVGYRSLTYFSRHFKDTFGMTPGEYRRRC